MSILQSARDLGHIRDQNLQVQSRVSWTELAQRATRSIAHDQKGSMILHTTFEHPHYMRMVKLNQRSRLSEEIFNAFLRELHLQHFKRRLRSEINVLT